MFIRTTLMVLAANLVACATPSGSAWSCAAVGLVNADYTGGETAMIRLSGHASGSRYAVALNSAGTEAVGVTANGTRFKCVKPILSID